MGIVAVVGMPGNTKSGLIAEFEAKGFVAFDDINKDWGRNIPDVVRIALAGRSVVLSDIEFCNDDMRAKLEREVGLPVQWIFFENNPYHCARNVVYRCFVERANRPAGEEIEKIRRLTKVYYPSGNVRPVPLADSNGAMAAE